MTELNRKRDITRMKESLLNKRTDFEAELKLETKL